MEGLLLYIHARDSIMHLCTDLYIWRLQEHFFESSDGSISDIYDGEGYKRFSSFLKHPAHVSLLLNTDGVAIYRSSVSIWPVWGVVNELPASIGMCIIQMCITGVLLNEFLYRYLRQHMFLLGIFVNLL